MPRPLGRGSSFYVLLASVIYLAGYMPFLCSILAENERIGYTFIMEQRVIDTIKKKLVEIEKEHGVNILYAVESGSRAWGFESLDSDYDVRFIYAHAKNWYLNILPKRDVIEYPIYR